MATTTPATAAGAAGTPAGSPTPRTARPSLVTTVARRWLPFAMVATTLVVMVREAAAPLSNPDTYFHLRFGRELIDDWSLRDPGHVTSWATADWVPTQWLVQEVMARLDAAFGLPGVAWYAGFQFVLLAVVLYLCARRWAEPVVAAPLLVLALLACSPGLSMRPQVLSYAATAAVGCLVLSVRYAERGRRRHLWLAVPLIWLWAMCHGMWPVGVVVLVVGLGGAALDRSFGRREALTLGAVPVAALLAGGLLTPVGPGLLPAVLLVNSRSSYFSEWSPPDFTNPTNLTLLLLLMVTVLVMVRRGADWTSIALVGLAAAFTVYSLRTVPVAACLLVPLAAVRLQGVLGTTRRPGRREVGLVLAGGALALGALAAVVPSTSADPPPQPDWVDPALTALPADTRVLNEQSFGGYLMWRYPDLDFMFSGYGDIYTTRELDTMGQVNDLKPGWDDAVRDAAPAVALLDPESPLAYALRTGEGWQVLHEDEDVVLLQPPPGWLDG